jgi:intracellular sulfur oxidation DsrE/DsrF family protein
MKTNILSLLILLLALSQGFAQEKKAGPVITEFGKVWPIDDPDFKTDKDREFKVVFDIMSSPENHDEINASIETAARFLNMHAQHGIAEEKLQVALVVHNKATKDIMTQEAYTERYGVPNPNFDLLSSLIKSGADVILCGQSSLSRDVPSENTIEGVQISLSAMTAIIQLTDQNYTLIKF